MMDIKIILEIVMPFLNAKNIPFSVFISTNHIETGKRFPTYILRIAFFENPNKYIDIPFLNKKYDISSIGTQKIGYSDIATIIKTSPQIKVDKIIEEVYNSLPLSYWEEKNEKYYSDQPMNWDDIDVLHENNILIGSHCHDHALLHSNQTKNDIIKQLEISKKNH